MTAQREELPVTVSELPSGYGSRYTLSIVPDGWRTAAAVTYTVSVSGIPTPISYGIQVVDCAE